MDDLQGLLTNKVLEHYPEIFNSSPLFITELKGILSNNISSFSDKISSLADKAEQEL
jgi:hypothetical protein